MQILVKRVYEPVARSGGFRVVVDRLWPRGMSKDDVKLDLWLEHLGPSTALRTWFNHDPVRGVEFQRRYHDELKEKLAVLGSIIERAKTGPVTLLYSAKDERHNQAVAIRGFLLERPATIQSRTISARKKVKPYG